MFAFSNRAVYVQCFPLAFSLTFRFFLMYKSNATNVSNCERIENVSSTCNTFDKMKWLNLNFVGIMHGSFSEWWTGRSKKTWNTKEIEGPGEWTTINIFCQSLFAGYRPFKSQFYPKCKISQNFVCYFGYVRTMRSCFMLRSRLVHGLLHSKNICCVHSHLNSTFQQRYSNLKQIWPATCFK